MFASLFSTMHNKARFSGIRIVPVNAPSLYQECVKEFVAEANRSALNGKRISELQFLPTAALVHIFEEMCRHPALRPVVREQLLDPVTFMKLFSGRTCDQLVLEKCLVEASLSGKLVLPDLTKSYCSMVHQYPLKAGSKAFINRLEGALKLGIYLREAGWTACAVDVLYIAKNMLALIRSNADYEPLTLECVRHLLIAEADCSSPRADETCELLLSLISGTTDERILVKVYLAVANYHYMAQRYDQSHEWTLKIMSLITDETPIEDVIEVLQLQALYCVAKQRYDLGNMLMSQAIQRASSHYGDRHRRFADVLQTYGHCLMLMSAFSDAIPVLMRTLDIKTRLYGGLTPHIPFILAHLAYAFYYRSHTTGRFDMALEKIDQAIAMLKEMVPGNKQAFSDFYQLREKILRGHDSAFANTKESKSTQADSYDSFTFPEIREKYLELNASFDAVAY